MVRIKYLNDHNYTMHKGQASIEYLLLTAGVVLIGVIASQAVIQSGTQVQTAIDAEVNAHVTPVDTIPPTTEIVCNGGTCLSKYNTDVNIGFACNDNLGGVGCAKTYYNVLKDGSPYGSGDCNQTIDGCENVVTLSAPSSGVTTYTITFYSEDLNGNIEGTKTVEISIGTSTSGIYSKCAFDWTPKWPKPGDTISVTATLTSGTRLDNATMTLAGSTLNASFNCGTLSAVSPSCTQPGIVLPSTPSGYVVNAKIEGYDEFGNYGECGNANIIVDGESPVVSITSPSPCQWYRTDFIVNVTADDKPDIGSSYLSEWEYKIEDGTPPEYTSGTLGLTPTKTTNQSFNVTVGPGKYCEKQGKAVCDVEVSFADRAGNTGSDTESYSIDYTAPTTTVNITQYGWTSSDFTITFTCTDNPSNGSGCDYIHYVLDDTLSSSNDKSGNLTFTKNGTCPTTGPQSGQKILQVTCPSGSVCRYTLTYYSVDVAGNQESEKTITLRASGDEPYLIDKQNPAADISPATYGWTNQPITITLSCWDGIGSGCRSNPYELYDYKDIVDIGSDEYPCISVTCGGCTPQNEITYTGCPSTASGTVTVDCNDGDVCVWYAFYGAEDCVGNWEDACGTLRCAVEGGAPNCYGGPYKIDKETPVISVEKYSANNEYYKASDKAYYYSDYTVTFTCNDNPNNRPAVSGCDTIHWEVTQPSLYNTAPSSEDVSAGGNETYTYQKSLCKDGKVCYVASIKAYAKDVAGNQSDWVYLSQRNFYVDKMAPSVSIEANPSSIYSDESTTIEFSANDCDGITHCAGLRTIKITVNGKEYKTYQPDGDSYSDQITLYYYDYQDTGTINVCIYATDNVGNTAKKCTSFTVTSACSKVYAGATWDAYCNFKDDWYYTGTSECSACGSSADPYSCDKECGSGMLWDRLEYRDYYCTLDPSGSPTCDYDVTNYKWELDTGSSCYLDCEYGLDCCNGTCYDPTIQVCCNGAVYTGVCCTDSDCPADRYICIGNDIYYRKYTCNNHSCEYTDTYQRSCTDSDCGGSTCYDDYYCNETDPLGNCIDCRVVHRSCVCSDGSCVCQVDGEEGAPAIFCDGVTP